MRIGQGSLKAPVYRKNKDIIRRYYEDLWNPWDLDAAHELIAPDMEFRGSLGVTVQGIVGFQSYMSTVCAAFPDFHDQVKEMVAEGDKVVARLTYTGTHLGEYSAWRQRGNAISCGGIAVFRISGDRVVEGWVMGDRWGLFKQISGPVAPNPST